MTVSTVLTLFVSAAADNPVSMQEGLGRLMPSFQNLNTFAWQDALQVSHLSVMCARVSGLMPLWLSVFITLTTAVGSLFLVSLGKHSVINLMQFVIQVV